MARLRSIARTLGIALVVAVGSASLAIAAAYPWLIVTTSFNDSQVMYWEPAKWVAKLRATKTDANLLYFKIKLAGGHGGSSGRYDYLREAAFRYALMLDAVGLAGDGK